jgi:hypothetical protein
MKINIIFVYFLSVVELSVIKIYKDRNTFEGGDLGRRGEALLIPLLMSDRWKELDIVSQSYSPYRLRPLVGF